MKAKMLGICICMLLFLTMTHTIMATAVETAKSTDNGVNPVFVRGLFKYINEDEEYFYVNILHAVIWELEDGNIGRHSYSFVQRTAKFSKPLLHFGGGLMYWWFIGECDYWGWVE